ncbi:hypothetical protein QUF61_15685 [Candidatus Venteria ishoeyi]|uniref:hypothetical protein n=1 Tax=Candidatus Venteria ishoeyi TaxID=1899563 RepID=UPI0025A52E54|nr:hypothetical protein [Candidatus Venteria ishoeyi]MDM8547929.1 hypothetical protein [Candidatus Venteria ishoeyi]
MNKPDEQIKQRDLYKLRQLLKTEYHQHLAHAADALLNKDNLEAAKHHLAWAKTAEKLLPPEDAKPHRSLFWPVFIGLLCIVILGLTGTLRLPGAEVAIEVETDGLTFQLYKGINKEGITTANSIQLQVKQLALSNVRHIIDWMSQPPDAKVFLDKIDQTGEIFELYLRSIKDSSQSQIYVTLEDIPAKSELSLRRLNDHNVEWTIKYGKLQGSVDFNAVTLTLESDSDELKHTAVGEIPDTLTFHTEEGTGAPIVLRTDQVDDFRLRQILIEKLSFGEENPPGTGRFESLVLGGKIRLLQTGKIIKLEEADILNLTFFESKPLHRRVEIIKNSAGKKIKGLKLIAEGYVKGIEFGPRGFERDLRPTLLEYIYHEQRLGFYWGSALFLWSLLWSIKRTLFP